MNTPGQMSETRVRLRAGITALGPTLLLIGFAYHPYIGNATDETLLAEAAAADTMRWGLSHLAIGVGYALTTLSFIAFRSFLREAGEERWSVVALPFAVLACSLFPILTGMEFALLAAAETGGDVEGVQTELFPWFVPVLATGAICFTVGAIGFAIASIKSDALNGRIATLVATALIVMAAVRFVPLGAAQIVIGVAGVVAFWAVAFEMWKHDDRGPAPR
jgi:hypothetical protein